VAMQEILIWMVQSIH